MSAGMAVLFVPPGACAPPPPAPPPLVFCEDELELCSLPPVRPPAEVEPDELPAPDGALDALWPLLPLSFCSCSTSTSPPSPPLVRTCCVPSVPSYVARLTCS